MKIQCFFLAFLCIGHGTACADLIVDPVDSFRLQYNGTYDNVVSANRYIGFTGLFFGVPHQTVDVSTNGNLNFSTDTAFLNTPMPTSVARISPLWDDLIVSGTNESVSEKVVSGMYYAVTWQAHQKGTGADVRFQAVWFGASTQISGFNFLTNDIAFSYSYVTGNFSNGDATVGLVILRQVLRARQASQILLGENTAKQAKWSKITDKTVSIVEVLTLHDGVLLDRGNNRLYSR